MTVPLALDEQKHQNWFKPRHRIAVYFGMHTFDACWKMKKGKLVQAMSDLPGARKDCADLKKCLEKY